MAKYVLLSFENDEEANAFVEAVQRHEECAGDHVLHTVPHPELAGEYSVSDLGSAFVRAVYKQPTKYCDCPTPAKARGNLSSDSSRGKKYGWWVHNKCGKPKKRWANGDAWYNAFGTNLLPVSKRAPEWRGDHAPQSHLVGKRIWDREKKNWVDVDTGELQFPENR